MDMDAEGLEQVRHGQAEDLVHAHAGVPGNGHGNRQGLGRKLPDPLHAPDFGNDGRQMHHGWQGGADIAPGPVLPAAQVGDPGRGPAEDALGMPRKLRQSAGRVLQFRGAGQSQHLLVAQRQHGGVAADRVIRADDQQEAAADRAVIGPDRARLPRPPQKVEVPAGQGIQHRPVRAMPLPEAPQRFLHGCPSSGRPAAGLQDRIHILQERRQIRGGCRISAARTGLARRPAGRRGQPSGTAGRRCPAAHGVPRPGIERHGRKLARCDRRDRGRNPDLRHGLQRRNCGSAQPFQVRRLLQAERRGNGPRDPRRCRGRHCRGHAALLPQPDQPQAGHVGIPAQQFAAIVEIRRTVCSVFPDD